MGLELDLGRLGQAVNRKARRFLRRFLTRKGNVALIFSLAFIPLSLLTLGAIDFHRASTVKNALQDAVDAASLAAARANTDDAAQVAAVANRVLNANMQSFPDVSITGKTFNLRSDGTVEGEATATVTPLVAGMFLGRDLIVKVDAEVVRANDKLEIVLVLDNTGSMQGAKISTLRTAAANFVEDIFDAAENNPEPDAVKIGIVPFSMTVRVGSTYQSANWIDNSSRSSLHGQVFEGAGNRFAMLNRMGLNWAGCVESRPYPYDVQETEPTASNPETLFVPYFAPDEPDIDQNRGNNIFRSYSGVGNDYLPDGISKSSADYGRNWFKHQGRIQKYGSSGLSTSGGKGPNQGCTMEPITRLSTDESTLKASIARMGASGNTNIPMGMVWGWHLLSPLSPFGDGAPYSDDEVTKVIILMTDGDNVNTEANNPNDSSYSGLGYIWTERLHLTVGSSGSQRRAKMDDRLEELCANIKAKGIVVYTMLVEVDGSTSDLLRACASRPDYFYDVQQASDMNDAFDKIAGEISRLRISK